MPALDPVDLARTRLGNAIQDVIDFRGETTIVVDPARIVEVCRFFRDTEGLEYDFVSDVMVVDYYPQEPRFAVCYHLTSMPYSRRLRLKVYVPDSENPHVPSITSVWPAANVQEREGYDMMGVVFDGHPYLKRILMPDDWEGHPQRKDYPLGYEPVQFSFNYDDIERLKPHGRE
jgi:NADH-quinone oxidoreductase subunit C